MDTRYAGIYVFIMCNFGRNRNATREIKLLHHVARIVCYCCMYELPVYVQHRTRTNSHELRARGIHTPSLQIPGIHESVLLALLCLRPCFALLPSCQIKTPSLIPFLLRFERLQLKNYQLKMTRTGRQQAMQCRYIHTRYQVYYMI